MSLRRGPESQMQYVLLNILCGLVFAQTLRYAQHRRATDYVVGAVNYVLAAAVSLGALALLAKLRAAPPLLPAAALGAACGASYFGQFLLILSSYRRAGVGITMAVASMGILVPVLLSWLLWAEAMTPCRWMAASLLPAVMILLRPLRRPLELSPRPTNLQTGGFHGAPRRIRSRQGPLLFTWQADAALLAVFLNSGLMSTLHKAVGIYAPSDPPAGVLAFLRPSQLVYEASLFAVAAACSVSYALLRRGRWGQAELTLGSVIGVSNVLGTLFAVVGLSFVAAAVFLPSVTCATITLSVVVSWILWGERVTPRQVGGVLLAICVVVLVNL